MGASLPLSHPRATAAAQAASNRMKFLLGMAILQKSITRLGQRLRDEVPRGRTPTHFVTDRSLLLGSRLNGLFAHHLLGTRLLQYVGALLRADSQGELDRGVAVPAHDVHVRAVPQQELHHLGVASRSG